MAEMRVICPGCAAEYRLPPAAIPAGGREVECTACGRVWYAARTSAVAATEDDRPGRDDTSDYTLAFAGAPHVRRNRDKDAPPAPPLSRRLPDTVLDILRDEVEHERRARMAEDGAFGKGPSGTGDSADRARVTAEPEWPATTITGTDSGENRGQAVGPPPAVEASASPRGDEPAPQPVAMAPAPPRTPAALAIEAPEPIIASAALPSVASPTSTPHRPVTAYRMGMGVAAMTAAACLALYLLAPGLSDAGPFGEALGEFRQMVDAGRIWLHGQVAGLRG